MNNKVKGCAVACYSPTCVWKADLEVACPDFCFRGRTCSRLPLGGPVPLILLAFSCWLLLCPTRTPAWDLCVVMSFGLFKVTIHSDRILFLRLWLISPSHNGSSRDMTMHRLPLSTYLVECFAHSKCSIFIVG